MADREGPHPHGSRLAARHVDEIITTDDYFWRVQDHQITSVFQVTDSATWEHALTNE